MSEFSDFIEASRLREKQLKQEANSTWFGHGLQASAPANWADAGAQNDPRTRLMREDPLWAVQSIAEAIVRRRNARPAWRKAVAVICRALSEFFGRWA